MDMTTFHSSELQMPFMKSGQGEAIKNVYDVYRGKSGYLWLVASNVENKADHIYMQGREGSDGFGGATLEFNISHGDKISLTGAWKSCSSTLMKDTGVDCKNYYRGFIVLALSKNKGDIYEYHYDDVIYKSGWMIGKWPYDLAEEMAQKKANELGRRIYYFAASDGGTTSFHKDPAERVETNDE